MNGQLVAGLVILASCCYDGAVAVTTSNNDLKKMLATEVMVFAVDMARILHNKSTLQDNIIFSPINVYAALSLSHLAASGKTRDQFADVLDWPKNNRQALNIHKNFGHILNSLQEGSDHPMTNVKIANGVFVDRECVFRSNFTNMLKEYYKSGDIFPLDFAGNPLQSTDMINEWISKATAGDIPQLFTEPLPESTNLILANTLYFNGRWAQRFPMENTRKATFNNYGNPIQVNMMNHAEYLPYINDSSLLFEAISKPYEGGEYSMVYFNMYEGQRHRNLSDYLSAEVVKKTVMNMKPVGVDYSIPRVKFTYINGLKNALEEQGLTGVFDRTTLTNMIESGPPTKLTDVYHGTSIEMDEEGTHAGALEPSQDISQDSPAPEETINFTVKTPFIVCLWHVKTSTCLFFGYIHKPEGKAK